MDTIITFLDAMFAPYPDTPRLAEAKAELRAMMEDAYADAISAGKTHNEAVGQVITDFGNLEELAPALGILPEIRESQAAPNITAPHSAGAWGPPVVTLPEAQALAEAKRTTARTLGNGVALLVLAAAPLFALTGTAGDAGLLPMTRDEASLIGLPLTLVLVAAGVLILVRRSRAFVSVRHLLTGRFTQDPIVSAWAVRLRMEHEGPRSRALATAVGLWIISAIPLVSTGILSEMPGHRNYSSLGAALTLVLVALGLWIFLPTNWAASTHSALAEEGRPADAPEGWRSADDVIGVIASAYWPLTIIIYLVWSFTLDAWQTSWVVWPVAGVLFGGIAAVVSTTAQMRRSRGH
ncbi:permease prefix domain 1-containing protein [Actinomyces respiraculi]|uniref:permease prefix domain 1-containing protein n=1 Tax=Actinomyces respiraculi TaxID=2744574 RepID=UPI001421E6AF|nr:permease prefix domain 1-containing protein [Actinomyces respiraculi]